VTRSQGGGGDYLHAVMALDAQDGSILGLVDGQTLQRSSGRKKLRRALPIEEKESFRWLQGADAAASVCAGARRITVVADREGDIYEAFARRPAGVELLIRASHDRSLDDGGKLFAALDDLPEAGRANLDLPASPGRKARTVQLVLRFGTFTVTKPGGPLGKAGPRGGLPVTVDLQFIDVREAAAMPASLRSIGAC
jgi:hypothetical protein